MGEVHSCGHKFPIYLVTYLVSNLVSSEQKTYSICENCEKIPCFSKYVIRKTPYKGQKDL